MPSQKNTLSKLLIIIHQQHHLDVSRVTMDMSLADIGLDSLAVAELLFSIEDEFKISMGEVESEAMPATVGELIALIESHQK